MDVKDGLFIISQVIVYALLLVAFMHEDRFVAFENRVCRAVKAKHIRRKRARAKAYLAKKGPRKAQKAQAYLEKTAPKCKGSKKAARPADAQNMSLNDSYNELLAASRMNVPEVAGLRRPLRETRLRLVRCENKSHDAA